MPPGLTDFCTHSYGMKCSFKLGNWWLNVEGFKSKVHEWWSSFEVSGRPDYELATKLSLLKTKLKEWSRENRKIGRQGKSKFSVR
ncbi:hypothetical protein H5410_002272 [Solanum commersonii]|uniref:Uncharacterized protein n=1 Tax=Solanum commersonii TaxID=4109 RepID=A0A9J6B1V9_SOLCO|nr:hypothetical protein H5410_002272 [Solanum commersonii]